MPVRDQPTAQMEHWRNQRLAAPIPEIIVPRAVWGGDNVVKNVLQGHGNSYRNIFPIFRRYPTSSTEQSGKEC